MHVPADCQQIDTALLLQDLVSVPTKFCMRRCVRLCRYALSHTPRPQPNGTTAQQTCMNFPGTHSHASRIRVRTSSCQDMTTLVTSLVKNVSAAAMLCRYSLCVLMLRSSPCAPWRHSTLQSVSQWWSICWRAASINRATQHSPPPVLGLHRWALLLLILQACCCVCQSQTVRPN